MSNLNKNILENQIDLENSKVSVIDIGSNSIRMLIYENFNYSRVPFFNENWLGPVSRAYALGPSF